MSVRRVLVTGAGGFIGSRLVQRLLDQGEVEITRLYSNRRRKKPPESKPGCRDVFGDINDPDSVGRAIEDQDVVVHLAGKIINDAGTMERINVDGTRNVLERCAESSNPPVTILTSSLAASGPVQNGKLLTETDPAAPVSLYGRTKREVELMSYEFADRVPITVLRPPVVFGPDDQNSFLLFKPIAQFGIHMLPGKKDLRFSLIHCDDLATATIAAMQSGQRMQPGEGSEPPSERGIYFVAAEETPFYSALGNMIGTAVGRDRVSMLHAPHWLIKVAAFFSESSKFVTGKTPILNSDKAKEITAGEWACNSERIKQDTGFVPEKELNERIVETVEWYFDNGWLKRGKRN